MGDEKVSVIFLGEMKAGKLFSYSRVCIYLERDSSVELGILLFCAVNSIPKQLPD